MDKDSDGSGYVREQLEILGIRRLAEWDLLMFFHRHGASLMNAEQISRLLGYSDITVREALGALTSTGLVLRSRNSNRVRFYRLNAASAGDARRASLAALIEVAGDREGRLLLTGCLRQAAGKELRSSGGLHLAKDKKG